MRGPVGGLCSGLSLQGSCGALRRSRDFRRPDRVGNQSQRGRRTRLQAKMTRRSEVTGIERLPGLVLQKHRRGLFHRGADLVLHCEDLPLPKLAERYGTPLYVYSATAIRERLASFQKAFRDVPHTICYSVKANSNVSILRLLPLEGCGFDVVSGGELERVLTAYPPPAKHTVSSGVGKSRDEMGAGLKAGILLFNVESESELWALTECATRLRTTAHVALRVNPDVAADTHPHISTG